MVRTQAPERIYVTERGNRRIHTHLDKYGQMKNTIIKYVVYGCTTLFPSVI